MDDSAGLKGHTCTILSHFTSISVIHQDRDTESQIIQGKMLQQLEIWIKYEHFFVKSSLKIKFFLRSLSH